MLRRVLRIGRQGESIAVHLGNRDVMRIVLVLGSIEVLLREVFGDLHA